jgi:hypothetical protein
MHSPLTRDEIMRISQIVISSDIKFSKQVRVFAEHGGELLVSSVLHKEDFDGGKRFNPAGNH